MRFNRVADSQTANQALHELKIIPQQLLDITDRFGISTYCFNKKICPTYIGLEQKTTIDDRGGWDDSSMFVRKRKAIYLFDFDLKDVEELKEQAFSVFIHEYAHALDYALGCKVKKDRFLSTIHPDILKRYREQKGLDEYANTCPHEYFAQAFMAYMYSDLETYKPHTYREHTRQELKEKDPDMFYYLRSLMS